MQLALAADERRRRDGGASPAPRIDPQQPEQPRTGARLALQRKRLERLDLDRVADQPQRLLAEQDLSGRAACSRRAATFTASPIARFSPSPTSTRPVLTPVRNRSATPTSSRDRRQPLTDLRRRPHRPQRVVLVHARDPEHRHHRIADELLDRPAVALDRRADLSEVPIHHPDQAPQGRAPRPSAVEPVTSQNSAVTTLRA